MNIETIRATTKQAQDEALQKLRAAAATHVDQEQKAWYALLTKAKTAIQAAAQQGKNYTEISVNNQEQYRDLAGHFEADGYKCSPDGDGCTQMVCVIKW